MTSSISIPWISHNHPLPGAQTALRQPHPYAGLIAAGEDLGLMRLKEAYSQGIFPWFSADQPILWWSPDPRMVLQTNQFRLHYSLKKTLKKFKNSQHCEIRINSDFKSVIKHCAQQPRHGQNGTWIVPQMIDAYNEFHESGFAHSVETWVDNKLVGGLYCINIGACVFGESMFSLQTDASKIALSALICFAMEHQLPWIDCQQNTRHLASLGAAEISREHFLNWVNEGNQKPSPTWEFKSIYWQHLLD
jgi:leucyl/phenylalanyl-tRNA---protein transferase